MVINTNITAQNAAVNLQHSQALLSKSLARLSSGCKLIDPTDDAAGLAVGVRLDAQVQRIKSAQSNVTNALSFTQTQDGYLNKMGKAFQRMSELAMLAQDVTKSDADRTLYDKEYSQLASYITTAGGKDFNGVPLFSSNSLDVTVDSEGGTFTMAGIDMNIAPYSGATTANPVAPGVSFIDTVANAKASLLQVNAAIDQMSRDRATVGAYQTRLNFTSDQLAMTKENLTAASSRIQDVDVAEETTEYAKENILVQAGTAMLAQANTIPQTALRLLQQ